VFVVYVLVSLKTEGRYVGQTADLEKRLASHNSDRSRYTKGRGPWRVVYTEEFPTRAEAVHRERFFKTGKGRDFLNNLGY
jgi:putative endonuclease